VRKIKAIYLRRNIDNAKVYKRKVAYEVTELNTSFTRSSWLDELSC